MPEASGRTEKRSEAAPVGAVLRPSQAQLRRLRSKRLVTGGIWALASLASATSIAIRFSTLHVVLVELLILLAIGALSALLSVRASRVALFRTSDAGVGRVDSLGRTHMYSRDEIARMVRLRIRSTFGVRPAAALVSPMGKAIVVLYEDVWDSGELDAFVGQLGIESVRDSGPPLSFGQFAKRFPRTYPIWLNHPNLTVSLTAIGAIALITAAILAAGLAPTR